jgi:hypothetical protein
MKSNVKDLRAERFEMKQLKKGVPHAKAERMEKQFLRKGSGRRSGR